MVTGDCCSSPEKQKGLSSNEIGVIVCCTFQRLITFMKPLFLLMAASFRSQSRAIKTHLYSWLILTPMVIGITYLSVSRLTEDVSLRPLSFTQIWLLATIFCLSLIGFTLSRAATELYHVRRPESYFDALPVHADTLFDFA